VTIDNLPGEVLLEVFDCYLQGFIIHLSLRAWNNKNGWFKLAHVCRKWRCIVLASSRRLRLLLFFAESTPTRAAVLESQSLSHLSIYIDYCRTVWNAGALTRLISALRYPDRVVRIGINGPRKHYDNICKALDLHFPALTSLELHNMEGNADPILQASSLLTSIKSIQYLRLANVSLLSFLPLLSVTRTLEFLNLAVDALFWQTGGASLLTYLQSIPGLRDIRVSTQSSVSNRMIKPPITNVFLAELSFFQFSGQCTEIEWFVAGLITPSLRGLRLSVFEPLRTLHISHLSKFLHAAGVTFFAARLTFSGFSGQTLTTSMIAYPHSTNDGTRIVTFETPSEAHLGIALSPMLAMLGDVFLCISIPLMFPRGGPLLRDRVHWRKFFEQLRNVKVLRLHHGLEKEIADVLRQPTVNPSPAQEEVHPDAATPLSGTTMNGSRSIFDLDIFPLLEKIVVYASTSDPIDRSKFVSGVKSLWEYAIARKQVGRPVEVLWSMNPELPKYYMLQ